MFSWIQILVQGLIGGLTGFYTNDLAIGKLFSKKGFLVKNKKPLIKNMAEMVENKLLTARIIQCRIESPDVTKCLEAIVEEYFSIYLDKTATTQLFKKNKNMLGDLPGFTGFLEKLQKTLQEKLNIEIGISLLREVLRQFTVSELLQEKEIKDGIDLVINDLISLVKKQDFFRENI